MSNKMWGGRFVSGPSKIMEEINASIDFDRKLAAQDIAGSKAHVAMLAETGIIAKADAAAIAKGLDEVGAESEAGRFPLPRAREAIHMNVESHCGALVVRAAGRRKTWR